MSHHQKILADIKLRSISNNSGQQKYRKIDKSVSLLFFSYIYLFNISLFYLHSFKGIFFMFFEVPIRNIAYTFPQKKTNTILILVAALLAFKYLRGQKNSLKPSKTLIQILVSIVSVVSEILTDRQQFSPLHNDIYGNPINDRYKLLR